MEHFNYFAVIVVAVLNSLLGMFWYSAKAFGPLWAKAQGYLPGESKSGPFQILGSLIVSFVTADAFALLVYWFDIRSVNVGLGLGFLLWIGFIATTHFSGVIWAKKPLKAYLVDAGFQLASMLMMGLIFSLWR